MYLVSLYFDDKSSKKIQSFIDKVALKCENNFMTEGEVPPHITIAAFQTSEENKVIELLDKNIKSFTKGKITWASIGVFKSSVIFLAPILNKYLHDMSVSINKCLLDIKDINISKYYLPFQWMPHTTIAKKLNNDELILAFKELEKNFIIFNGPVTKIALSKTNPYENIIEWNL